MQWCEGDIIDIAKADECDVIAFSANSYVTSSFRLVMGAGAAKRVRDHFHDVDFDLGSRIRVGIRRQDGSVDYPNEGVQGDYHVAGVERNGIIIAALQVKKHYLDHQKNESKEACWELTVASLEKLKRWCDRQAGKRIVLNCPLIGLGGYGNDESRVKSMVENVLGSANVRVCTLRGGGNV